MKEICEKIKEKLGKDRTLVGTHEETLWKFKLLLVIIQKTDKESSFLYLIKICCGFDETSDKRGQKGDCDL